MVPFGVPVRKAEEFLHSKEDWVKQRLTELEKVNGRYFLFGKEVFPEIKNGILEIHENEFKGFSPSPEMTALFENYLYRLAKNYIPKRVGELAFLHRFNFNKVSVKKLKSRWGSCSSKKNLSFNYLLLKNSKDAIDYVIIHELCHTKEMNHSKRFWSLVEEAMPEYKKVKKKLRMQFPM